MKVFETVISEQVSVWVTRAIKFEAEDIEEANRMSIEDVIKNHIEYGDSDYQFETEDEIQVDFVHDHEIEEIE